MHIQHAPLALKARPSDWSDFIGRERLQQKYPFLFPRSGPPEGLTGLVIWGNPGTGKTTLAHLFSRAWDRTLYPLSGVMDGISDFKKLLARMEHETLFSLPILFIDEIHRFNRAQQDALLPYVEEKKFLFIGATTENPAYVLNKALLSRVQVIHLPPLTALDISSTCAKVVARFELDFPQEILPFIGEISGGDMRKALNFIDLTAKDPVLKADHAALKAFLLSQARSYDRNHDRHYDVISAFIKSMRGSDPDAALVWLAVMLDGGEDPLFVARRMVIFASEDVGNADPRALPLATSALAALQHIGMPEGRIILAQVVTYLAATVKSNASYLAVNEAMEWVKNRPTLEVPDPLRNNLPDHLKAKPYLYPHDYPGHFVPQEYTSVAIPKFYRPEEAGQEKFLKERLDKLWQGRSYEGPKVKPR